MAIDDQYFWKQRCTSNEWITKINRNIYVVFIRYVLSIKHSQHSHQDYELLKSSPFLTIELNQDSPVEVKSHNFILYLHHS